MWNNFIEILSFVKLIMRVDDISLICVLCNSWSIINMKKKKKVKYFVNLSHFIFLVNLYLRLCNISLTISNSLVSYLNFPTFENKKKKFQKKNKKKIMHNMLIN